MQDFQLDKHQNTFGGKCSPRHPSRTQGPTSKWRGGVGEGGGIRRGDWREGVEGKWEGW